jgi:hypothetical protein
MQRWPALPPLPPAWEQPLARRAGVDPSASAGDARTTATVDDLLLQAEVALDIASPADAQAARRDLKLRAMKAALEGGRPARGATATMPSTPGGLLAALLARPGLTAGQRQRLGALIAALAQRGPIDPGPVA